MNSQKKKKRKKKILKKSIWCLIKFEIKQKQEKH